MWCLMSSEAQPTSRLPEVRRTSTRSSATRRWPRMIEIERGLATCRCRSCPAAARRCRARPSARRGCWRWAPAAARGTSGSDRSPIDDTSGVRSSGTPSRSALSRRSCERLEPLGDHHTGRVEAEERLHRFLRLRVRQGLRGSRSPWRPGPAPAPDGPAGRSRPAPAPASGCGGSAMLPPEARLPREQRQTQARPLVEQRSNRQRRRHDPIITP